MSTGAATLPTLSIVLGADESGVFAAGLPVLAGDAVENLFGAGQSAGRQGAFALFQMEGWLLGAATVPLAAGLEKETHRLYEDIFRAIHGRHLARIWNYVPAINEPGPGALENYHAFCQGRSLAFEQQYGSGFKTLLPAASAVGNKSAALMIAFAACPVQPRHVENPLQVSAYDYPGAYGPRPPSFARATVVPGPECATVFVSGTAAIRGFATVAPDSTRQQLECTLENLRGISVACGLGPSLDLGGSSTRHFKVYLRHAADQPLVAVVLEQMLLTDKDHVSYLLADMCRAPLLVEIEASLFGVAASRA
jgi:chorismate lyase / 3-hydroxybenzoate synthase